MWEATEEKVTTEQVQLARSQNSFDVSDCLRRTDFWQWGACMDRR